MVIWPCIGCRAHTSVAMSLISIFFFSLTLTFAFAEIKLVNVLFRHGDRAPGNYIRSCPNCCDTNSDCNKFYPIGLGGLTNQGKQRVYKLGKFLRTNYDTLLGPHYISENVEAVSSDSPRTRMSLQLVLAGLYPPSKIQTWNDNIRWQPTLTSFKSNEEDTIFVPQKCQVYTSEYKRVLASSEFKRQIDELTPFLADLGRNMGKNATCSLLDANNLYHTLAALKAMKLALPIWAAGIYPNGALRKGALLQYQLYGYNDQLKRLAGGVLLRKMIDDMKNTREKKNSNKIHLYSGHELNIVMLLQTLGLYDDLIPQYSSAIIIELHEIKNKYFIKVFYYYGIPLKVDMLQIPGCTELCPLDEFTQLLEHVTPSDEDLNCRRTWLNMHITKNHYL
ncbi:venom acid phosphatase Acph-1-like [Phymastichus coffea]|uniref:venom acid phosphatase Acph-1-like n=1 Tax=Phymastichus coffea TaxID=108790 RepID=UPI00273CF4C6|nr:venom acid phosphatase Acph-1-like [Phymastichus coffea]